MQESFSVRIRHSSKQFEVTDLTATTPVCELVKKIALQLNCKPEQVSIKFGFPPKPLDTSSTNPLEAFDITSGESLIAETKAEEAPKQIPDVKENVMIRRIIPADNSCLFNSIAYALEGRAKDRAPELRGVVAGYILSDPEKYNEVFLEKSNSEYGKWIMKDESWGGAIEIDILANEYRVEMCCIDIQSLHYDVYGQGYSKRIYLLYDGIHYDILVKNQSEKSDPATDITVFDPADQSALQGALALAKECKLKKDYTDVYNFALQCGTCYEGIKGNAEAIAHSKKTGHTNFVEYRPKK